ncbi:hypothetical protein [Streptomyces sp. NPDC057545]|uniref:hypothetical protein n=1 Tax=Streptomyces sp. NPDC057545 TaxID=3346164 RepID=UPI0036892006
MKSTRSSERRCYVWGVAPENAIAKSLYESFGFLPTGQSICGEEILQLQLASPR